MVNAHSLSFHGLGLQFLSILRDGMNRRHAQATAPPMESIIVAPNRRVELQQLPIDQNSSQRGVHFPILCRGELGTISRIHSRPRRWSHEPRPAKIAPSIHRDFANPVNGVSKYHRAAIRCRPPSVAPWGVSECRSVGLVRCWVSHARPRGGSHEFRAMSPGSCGG